VSEGQTYDFDPQLIPDYAAQHLRLLIGWQMKSASLLKCETGPIRAPCVQEAASRNGALAASLCYSPANLCYGPDVVCTENSNPHILVMKSAKDGHELMIPAR
jgi:hypothetical protein